MEVQKLIFKLSEGLKARLKTFLHSQPESDFGGSGITSECFQWIVSNLTDGGRILEFGAGNVSTPKLGARYELTSVEHDPLYVSKFDSKYIYAPLSNNHGWYEGEEVSSLEFEDFDLALIDGPPGTGNRFGILLHLNIVSRIPIIIIDDTNRPNEKLLSLLLAKNLNRSCVDHGSFSVLTKTP
jgi:hypothetical protein